MSDSSSLNQEERELRNAVFAAKEAAEKAQMISQVEAARKSGISVQAFPIPLPSRGLLYPTDHPLHNQETVEVFGMTARQEDILMSKNFIKKGTVITELIKSCLVDKSIDVNSLVSGDRNALMFGIRVTGYGPEYTPSVVCTQCELRQEFPIDLRNLNVKMLEVEPVETGVNKFNFTLPMSKETVMFKFLTGKEEEELLATTEAKKKKGILVENSVTSKLLYSILSINGETSKTQLAQKISYMSAKDSLSLRKYMNDIEPTVDTKVDFNCISCENSEVIGLPFGPSFFWPDGTG